MAFVWNGEKQDNDDIYVKLIDGGAPLRLTTNPAGEGSPAWSPDGHRIAFLRESGDRSEIFVISALGGPERKLGESSKTMSYYSVVGLSWSADGKSLAIVDSGSIFLLSTETGEKRRLTLPPPDSSDLRPTFSPDGQTLAFIRRKIRV